MSALEQTLTGDARKRAKLLDGYVPLADAYDELMDSDGRIRPHWQELVDSFASLGTTESTARAKASGAGR